MKLPTKSVERKLFSSGYGYICAVDEVGMGCLAGPVVVCAVGITNHFYKKHYKKLHWLRDSKLLQPNQREKFAKELMQEKDLVYMISLCSAKTIDKINIYQASRRAMKRALLKITTGSCYSSPQWCSDYFRSTGVPSRITPFIKTIVLVDGKNKIQGLNLEQLPIVKGDRKIFAIACASVIAKVYRDKIMTRYAKKYPEYGFEKHKGYGTKYHQVQLASFGPCAIHRRSFRLKYS